MQKLETIVVAVDFSSHSERALEYAIALASKTGAKVHLVHAMHLPADVRMTGEWWASMRARATEALHALADRLDAAGVKWESHLESGPPWEAIVRAADRVDADLIAMGSRGRSALKHVLLGSVAERTLRAAGCPVLTVRADEA